VVAQDDDGVDVDSEVDEPEIVEQDEVASDEVENEEEEEHGEQDAEVEAESLQDEQEEQAEAGDPSVRDEVAAEEQGEDEVDPEEEDEELKRLEEEIRMLDEEANRLREIDDSVVDVEEVDVDKSEAQEDEEGVDEPEAVEHDNEVADEIENEVERGEDEASEMKDEDPEPEREGGEGSVDEESQAVEQTEASQEAVRDVDNEARGKDVKEAEEETKKEDEEVEDIEEKEVAETAIEEEKEVAATLLDESEADEPKQDADESERKEQPDMSAEDSGIIDAELDDQAERLGKLKLEDKAEKKQPLSSLFKSSLRIADKDEQSAKVDVSDRKIQNARVQSKPPIPVAMNANKHRAVRESIAFDESRIEFEVQFASRSFDEELDSELDIDRNSDVSVNDETVEPPVIAVRKADATQQASSLEVQDKKKVSPVPPTEQKNSSSNSADVAKSVDDSAKLPKSNTPKAIDVAKPAAKDPETHRPVSKSREVVIPSPPPNAEEKKIIPKEDKAASSKPKHKVIVLDSDEESDSECEPPSKQVAAKKLTNQEEEEDDEDQFDEADAVDMVEAPNDDSHDQVSVPEPKEKGRLPREFELDDGSFTFDAEAEVERPPRRRLVTSSDRKHKEDEKPTKSALPKSTATTKATTDTKGKTKPKGSSTVPSKKKNGAIKAKGSYYEEEDEAIEEEKEEEFIELWGGFRLPAHTYEQLYPYQKEGVQFLWSLYEAKTGGILGDEMGLGKTIQAVTFILGILISGLAQRVMIVTPLSVMANWQRELEKWSKDGALLETVRTKDGSRLDISVLHGAMNQKKKQQFENVLDSGGICFTTYGSIPKKVNTLSRVEWDVVLLDEGHKIKNHRIALSQSLRRIPSRTRILLTGTPIQNNLKELWSLFDYTCKGELLGTIHRFGRDFEQPIRYATYKNATSKEKQLAAELTKQLRNILAPHFLRRERKDVFGLGSDKEKDQSAKAGNEEGQEDGGDAEGEAASMDIVVSKKIVSDSTRNAGMNCRMNDFIVWLPLSEVQEKLYRSFLQSGKVRELLTSTKNILESLVLLKKLCDHPHLLTINNAASVDPTLLASWYVFLTVTALFIILTNYLFK
jgi:SNF2 family DNA or RNA helicase